MSHRFTVDYAEDLAFVQAVFEALHLPGRAAVFAWRTSSGCSSDAPTSSQLNRHLAGVNWYRHHLAELRTVGSDETQTVEAESCPADDRCSVSPICEARALRVREHIVRMSGGGGCFIGASLSCADLLVYLYSRVLRRLAGRPATTRAATTSSSPRATTCPRCTARWPSSGYIDRASGSSGTFDPDDHLYWHPNRQIPGVEFHSGSLGHLLVGGGGRGPRHQAARRRTTGSSCCWATAS